MPKSPSPNNALGAAALIIILMVASATGAAETWPRSRAYRTLAAELIVLAGDVQRLREDDPPPQRRDGLWLRIRGGLAALPLMYRESGLPPPRQTIARLRKIHDPALLHRQLEELGQQVPFDTTGILPPDDRPAALAMAKTLHQTHCAACHDGAPLNPNKPLAAEDLFAMAGAMDEREFAARLHNGVRGDQLTGLVTPLSDMDQAALLGYYRRGL